MNKNVSIQFFIFRLEIKKKTVLSREDRSNFFQHTETKWVTMYIYTMKQNNPLNLYLLISFLIDHFNTSSLQIYLLELKTQIEDNKHLSLNNIN
jgi:hypothetical protein